MMLKAALPRWFSIGVFAVVQVAIDVETATNMALGRYPLHDAWHTVPGSLAVAVVVTVPARFALSALYRRLPVRLSLPLPLERRLAPELRPIPWPAAIVGAVVGALSHVALDAVIHSDVRPLAPLTAGNPLFIAGSFVWVHVACAVAGTIGLVAWLVMAGMRQSPEPLS